MTLRDYQLRALDEAGGHFARGARAVLLQLATGLGKTRTAVHACQRHLEKGGRGVLFVAPRRELVTQATAAFGGPHPKIHVRTIQSLTEDVPDASLVVLDEARHYLSDEWSKLREKLPDAFYLGLDATPERSDGRGLGTMFDAIVPGLPVREAIRLGYLVAPEVVRPDRALEAGELAQGVVDAYEAHAPDTKAIVFLPSVAEASRIATAFRERGVLASHVSGEMPDKARDGILADFASDGGLRVLTNAQLLTEGYDCPDVETVILARGFGTAGAYLQAVGRALRPAPGKTKALILDLRGISHVHGDPDEPRTYHLSGKAVRRKGEGEDVRFCPVCGAPTATQACEQCGHAGEMRLRPPRVLGLPMTRFAKLRQDDEEQRALRLSRWLAAARARGWREGQAMHRFRAAYGTWPDRGLVARARSMMGGG